MNKKFLSAILFGALMVTSTGTFVSCKDYDDEIDDLQEQINKLATKEDMTSQIASLQSALTAAQSEAAAAKASAEDALKKAQEALDNVSAGSDEAAKLAAQAAADAAQAAKDAADAKVEAIKAAQDEVAKVKAELEASIDAKFEAAKGEFAETIAELTKKVEDLTGYTTQMVTSIHLLEENGYTPSLDLNYFRIGERVYKDGSKVSVVYPEGLRPKVGENATEKKTGKFTFGKEGDKELEGAFTVQTNDVNTVAGYMLANVAPVNAAVSSESLSLISGAGNSSVNEYLDLTAVSYNGDIIKGARSASTGLYKIGVQLKKDVNFEAFDKLVLPDDVFWDGKHETDVDDCKGQHGYIGYALAVSDASRTVTSDFDVTMHVQKEQVATGIAGKSEIYSSGQTTSWAISEFSSKNSGDNTSDEDCFSVENKEPFCIDVKSATGHVMASYVIVDTENPNLTKTDKAALSLISVTGDVNKVLEGPSPIQHAITLTGETGIPVPLKLVTIDYTGNVEVNVIWVKIGEPEMMTVAFSVTPTINVSKPTSWEAESTMEEFKVPAGTVYYSLSWVVSESEHQYSGDYRSYFYPETTSFADINSHNVLELYKSDKLNTTAIPNEVAYAKFVGSLNLQQMKDDETEYAGHIKFYDKTGTYLGHNTLTVKKVLPTVIPDGLTAKTNAIWADGTLPVYPKPNASTIGIYDLKNSFNISDELASDENLVFSTPTFVNGGTKYAEYGARNILIYNKDIIDAIEDAPAFPTTVTYNYGDIKFHPEGHGVQEPEDCKVTWSTKFSIKFGCAPLDSKYSWYTEPEVYYQTKTIIEGIEKVGNAIKYHDFMVVKNPYGYEVNPFNGATATNWANDWGTWADYLNTNKNVDVLLWTNGDYTRQNEFFTATYELVSHDTYSVYGLKLTPNPSVTTVLEADVPTTVVLVVKDKFNHTHYIPALTFTMKKGK